MTASNRTEDLHLTGEDIRWLEGSRGWRRLLPAAAFVLAAVGIVNVGLALWAGQAHDFPPGQLLRDVLVGVRWDAQYTGLQVKAVEQLGRGCSLLLAVMAIAISLATSAGEGGRRRRILAALREQRDGRSSDLTDDDLRWLTRPSGWRGALLHFSTVGLAMVLVGSGCVGLALAARLGHASGLPLPELVRGWLGVVNLERSYPGMQITAFQWLSVSVMTLGAAAWAARSVVVQRAESRRCGRILHALSASESG